MATIKTSKKKKEEKPNTSIPIYNSKGEEAGTFELDKGLFNGEVNEGAIYQALLAYNANQRQGTVSTKTISEVSGGGKKPWAQKGTGRARHGSIRSPLWRGGGKTFGPHPRDFHYRVPKKIKNLALLSCLNAKLKGKKGLIGIESLSLNEPKTKKFKEILDALKLKGKVLFILDSINETALLASRNLKEVALKSYRDFNMVDLLKCESIVISKAALAKLPERLKVK